MSREDDINREFAALRDERQKFNAVIDELQGTAGDLRSLANAMDRLGMRELADELVCHASSIRQAIEVVSAFDALQSQSALNQARRSTGLMLGALVHGIAPGKKASEIFPGEDIPEGL